MLVVVMAACSSTPRPDATVTIDLAHAGARIPDDFAGASYETSEVTGGAYFRPDNTALRATFTALGLRHLRIGGNDADSGALPAPADNDALLAFAGGAGLPIIYTLRLATYDPAAAATTAHAMLDQGAGGIECFAAGNEPDHYLAYADYRTEATAYMSAIADARAHYCGPDALPAAYVTQFATDFAPRGDIAAVTVHEYFGGGGQGIGPADARDKLLSPAMLDAYATERDAWSPAISAAHLSYRLDETNSFANGGAPGASDTFASTLWGLDYLYWWADAGAAGLDFHTGDHVSGATTTYPMFVTSSAGYAVRPLGYAVKAFDLGAHGRVVPAVVSGANDLTAYAVLADDGSVVVTVIDKRHGATDTPHTIEIDGLSSSLGDAWWLRADAVDATNVTLGGSAISDQAAWSGVSEAVGAVLTMPPATAVVVRYHG